MLELRVHGYRFEMPPGCACCLSLTERRQAFADAEDPHGPIGPETPRFPWCDRCRQHARLRRWMRGLDRLTLYAGPVLVAAALAISVLARAPVWGFLLLAAFAVASAVFVHLGAKRLHERLGQLPGCATGDLPLELKRESDDAWQVRFENGHFGRQFARLNLPEAAPYVLPRPGAIFPQNEAPGRGLLGSHEAGHKRTFLN